MQNIKIIIVEDESLVAADLEYQLQSLGYRVCAIAKSYTEAMRSCAMYEPDLVLMDIKIQGETDGIDTADKIVNTYNIPIIFLSDLQDNETLNRAKKTGSHTFLGKPISEFDLNASITFALENHSSGPGYQAASSDKLKDSLFIREEGRLVKILSKDILWVQADGAYCKVRTLNKSLVQSKNMREFCEHLDPNVFMKIHKSYTINAEHIEDIEGSEVNIGGQKLPIGKTFLQTFKRRLNIV